MCHLTPWVRDDLLWFDRILRCEALQGVPTRLFAPNPPVDIHVYMDASDDGLCVLDPAARAFIAIQFNAEERCAIAATPCAFDINVREQFAVALTCLLLGPSWRAAATTRWPHVRCWTDNRTAAARTNMLSAQHPQAQELNRCIGFLEAALQLHVSAAHLPGALNVVADAGSRLNDPRSRALFTNVVRDWSQVPVPPRFRAICNDFSSSFKPHHWLRARNDCMTARGPSGVSGDTESALLSNCPAPERLTLSSSLSLPSRAGQVRLRPAPTARRLFCPNVAMSHGIVGSATATALAFPTVTASPSSGCVG
jgi:hypothetical protein